MACASPDHVAKDGNPRLKPEAVDACFGGPCRPTPNYVGKVVYIMSGDYAGHGNSGLFYVLAQDGESRLDAIPLHVGYGGHEIKRFNLQPKTETYDNKTKVKPGASISQVRDDDEYVLDWARRQYRWGTLRVPGKDGKLEWVGSVYTQAASMAEMVVAAVAFRVAETERVLREIHRSYQNQFNRAVKDELYRRSYGG
jgi:hypothetical protein